MAKFVVLGNAVLALLLCCSSASRLGAQPQEAPLLRADQRVVRLDYPRRVEIPRDIPAVDTLHPKSPGEAAQVIIPTAIYLEAHYDGWHEFMHAYASVGASSLGQKWQSPLVAVGEPYTFRGLEDGYNDARAHLLKLQKELPEQELRTLAKGAYAPRKPSIPPPPR